MSLQGYIFNRFLLFVNFFSRSLATQFLHLRKAGKWPNLRNPKDFNEKLQWLKLNEESHLKSKCADKYAVYEYAKEKGLPEIINNVIQVVDDPDDIKWEILPEKVAIKCTHGSGYNIVTTRLSSLDRSALITNLKKWLKEDYGNKNLEYHYSDIKPRILIEDYIENKEGKLPIDYKLYCFHGEPKLVLVCTERTDDLRRDFFDLEWNYLPIGLLDRANKEMPVKPKSFDRMVEYAKILSSEFAFVRVDFYDKDGIPVLGEMTFSPAANASRCYNEYGLKYLGGLLDLTRVKRGNI